MDLWGKNVTEPMKGTMIRLVLKFILSDRGGSSMSKEESSMIHCLTCSIVDVKNLNFYEDIFEKPYLKATEIFYRYQVLLKG